MPIELDDWKHSAANGAVPGASETGANGTADMHRIAARAVGATKVYGKGDAEVRAIDGIDIEFAHGAFTAIMGPSGSGKSTLMQCMAGLDRLTSGQTWIGDVELTALSERQITKVRRDRVGFIFQAFNLVPTLTALENIRLPLDIAGREPEGDWMEQVIDALHLRPRLKHRPTELSGGQQQRVAAARALVSRPEIVFADEPTGQLDSQSSIELLAFMRRAADEFGQTIVMVTHEPTAASCADRVVFLADGRIVNQMTEPTPDSILDRMKTLAARAEDMIVRQAFRNLLASKLRLFLTSLAVVLGVGFVVGALVLGDTINTAFDGVFETANKGVAVEVRGVKTVSETRSAARAGLAAGDDPRGRRRADGARLGFGHRPDHRQGRQARGPPGAAGARLRLVG